MTLLELLIGSLITMMLIALVAFQVRGLFQKAKVSTAKSTINAYALSLGMIKDDTFLYPKALSDTKEASPPEGYSYRDWCGPYAQRLPLNDPWDNPYFYQLNEGLVFGPETYERQTPPVWITLGFSGPSGNATLVIDNPGITAARMYLNNVEVVSPFEFQNIIPLITKALNLLSNNTIRLRITSNPNEHIVVRITSPRSRRSTFTLKSYGRDGKEGGTKYDADIEYGEIR